MIIISKLKHITIRLVACILVIAISLQFVVMPMSAYGDGAYKCTSNVTLPSLRDNDWTNAEKIIKPNGNLNRGYFHDQVRDHIAVKYHLIPEFPITYQACQKKDKEKGFADLCLPTAKYAYLWEIKPVHYGLNPVLEQEALEVQLGGYVNSNSTYRYGHESGLTIQKVTFTSMEGKYTITYEDALNGLILYRYDRIPQKESEKCAKRCK